MPPVDVVRPSDPFELTRFNARLAAIPEGQRAAVAARTGNPFKIDAMDLEPSMMGIKSYSESAPTQRLATDIGLINIATAALSKPNVSETEFRNAIRGLATGVENAASMNMMDITGSDLAQFRAYRSAIQNFERAVFSARLSITLDMDVAQQDAQWLTDAMRTIRTQLGEDPNVRAPIRLSAEIGGYDRVVPFVGWVLWHVDGKQTLSIGR